MVDLKTTADLADADAFGRTVYKFSYHTQAAFYLDGLNAVQEADRGFCFIVVEKSPPYGVAVYELGEDSLAEGRLCYRRWLRTYVKCMNSGVWPGYQEGMGFVSIPSWGFKGEVE